MFIDDADDTRCHWCESTSKTCSALETLIIRQRECFLAGRITEAQYISTLIAYELEMNLPEGEYERARIFMEDADKAKVNPQVVNT